jgi:hypothetical protein
VFSIIITIITIIMIIMSSVLAESAAAGNHRSPAYGRKKAPINHLR